MDDDLREAEALRKALGYPVFDISKKNKQTIFTTKPKTRRHVRGRISGNRTRAFMEYLWRKKFYECRYKALAIQFIQYFETNDLRIIEKYIGNPKQTIRSNGSSLVRQNRNSGKVAHFLYSNTRRKAPKTGLMETLGYLTLNEESGACKLHHEVMPYFMKQSTLPPHSPPLQSNEWVSQQVSEKASKDNLCVSPIQSGDSKGQDSSACMEIERREKRERVIDHTHKSSKRRVKLNGELHLIELKAMYTYDASLKNNRNSLSNTEYDGGSLSNTSELEVSILKLNGGGHYAYHCVECGEGIKKNKTMLCKHCNGKRHARLMQRKKTEKFLLDKEFIMKGVCPKCHRKGSLHKRWVKNGVTDKRYTAYYFGHYDPEKQNVKWCYVPKKTALLYLTTSRRDP